MANKVSDSIEDSKEFKKALKTMGDAMASEFLRKPTDELNKLISVNTVAISTEKEALHSTPEYVKAKANLKDLNAGFREAVQPLKNAIGLADLIIRSRK